MRGVGGARIAIVPQPADVARGHEVGRVHRHDKYEGEEQEDPHTGAWRAALCLRLGVQEVMLHSGREQQRHRLAHVATARRARRRWWRALRGVRAAAAGASTEWRAGWRARSGWRVFNHAQRPWPMSTGRVRCTAGRRCYRVRWRSGTQCTNDGSTVEAKCAECAAVGGGSAPMHFGGQNSGHEGVPRHVTCTRCLKIPDFQAIEIRALSCHPCQCLLAFAAGLFVHCHVAPLPHSASRRTRLPNRGCTCF